jgi:hypothetical protein
MVASYSNIQHFILTTGWIGMLFGIISGALIGLFFHRDEWLGGYTSFTRRMVRLGHISFFGLGFLNILFALTLSIRVYDEAYALTAVAGLTIGAITMPVCCFLCAWRKKLWLLFPVPVTALLIGTLAIVIDLL